jgi:glutathione-regulated potassium-efflux system ancillary protein KefG
MSRRRVLILFAHPALEKSRFNQRLVEAARTVEGVTVNDLYELYPDFDINVAREQSLLREHDAVVWQHPLYWYSSPALLKEWQDLVLAHGFAYGSTGTALRGKIALNAITTGGPEAAYSKNGYNRFTLRELLAPFDQTAALCGITYLAPFVVAGTHRLQPDKTFDPFVERYCALLAALVENRLDLARAAQAERINDLVDVATITAKGGA